MDGIKSLSKPATTPEFTKNNHEKSANADTSGRWEYLTMTYNYSYGSTTYVVNGEKAVGMKNVPLQDALTHFGQEGWELVSISEGIFVLKRQGVRQIDLEKSAKQMG